ncbi:hypothetical protein BCR42DRAFT_410935 [Absidia repens]|uniref:RNB domain-containing protein n=1 Tax=Absidia repens TaxID=90262 RepID=A0A1X2IL41_9FUNG|nr:hypothetical protein BCR42DRAFT_410935 [Absidia repens]
MSSDHQNKNSRQHRYNPTNRSGPQPQRNMERSWRRPEAPAQSEMSASAWRSPQEFIVEQDQRRLAEHLAEKERNAGSSLNPAPANTTLEVVDRPLSPTTTSTAATSTPSTFATTDPPLPNKGDANTTTEYNSEEHDHQSKYYVNVNQSEGFVSVEDINVIDSSSQTSGSPGSSSTTIAKSIDVESSTNKNSKNANDEIPSERTKHVSDNSSSWRNFSREAGNKYRQRNDSGNRNRQNQQKQQNGQWKHVHPDDKHFKHQPVFYNYFMEYNEVMSGLEKGDLYKCQLRINKRKRMDAYATSDILGEDIYLCGDSARNRALDGDVVVVRLLDVDAIWKKRTEREKRFTEKRKQQPQDQQQNGTEQKDETVANNANDDTAIPVATLAEDDTVNAKDNAIEQEDDDENSDRKPKYAGEVVYILDRGEGMTYTGIISTYRPGSFQKNSEDSKKSNEIKHVWFKPTDKRTPLMMIDIRNAPHDVVSNAGFYEKHLVEAALVRWPISFRAPFGRIIRSLGPIGVLKAEEQAMLTDNNIMDAPFDNLVMTYLDKIPRTITASEITKRRDLRNELVFTIDPLAAKDLDDALHIKCLDDGNFEVGVHIADVSYYVKQDTLLDAEARKRGTTTYLVNRSIPMLPNPLCEDLCSLTPLEDKLAFSVIWKLDHDGNIIDTWFGRTVIRSCAKLAYDDVQSVIDQGHLPKDTVITDYSEGQVESNIMDLFKLSTAMRKRRYDGGALSMNSVKLSFTLNEDDEPIGVSVFEAKEANKLVEEFMLLANISVAQKIWEAYPSCSLLRRHECPIERRLNQFLELTGELGYDFDIGSAAGLQSSFDKLDDVDVKNVLLVLAIQPMKRATYICSGAVRNKQYLHYALNQDYYTHFTSPIRRYADVVVHRLLDAAISGKEDCGYDTKLLQKIALRCNRKKDGAKNAQESDIMLYLADYLTMLEKKEGTQVERAVVIGVNKKRFDVYVPKYGLEYCIQPGALPMQDFVFDDGRLDLFWKAGIPVNAAYFEKARERKWDDADDDNDEDNIENTDDNGHNNEGTQAAENDGIDQITRQLSTTSVASANKNGEDLPRKLHPAPLDNDKCMQSIDMLATINVHVIPDKSQTPPRIHIFPVNPF